MAKAARKSSHADEFDVVAKGEVKTSPNVLAKLTDAIKEAGELEAIIEELEEALAAAKANLHAIRSSRLPDIMAEAQSTEFTHNKWKATLGNYVSGSLPKDPEKRKKALAYLKANEGEGLIKTNVSIAFGKGEAKKAKAIVALLKKEKLAPVIDEGVHPQTLQAWARQRLEDGKKIDGEAIGLGIGKYVKVVDTTAKKPPKVQEGEQL